MKVLVVFCCLLVATALGDGASEEMEKYVEALKAEMEQCAKELNFPPEYAQKLHDGTASGEEVKAIGCMRSCIMEKIKVVEGEDVKLENFKSTVEKVHEGHPDMVENRMKILESCLPEMKGDSDKCLRANAFANCYMKKMME